MRAFQIPGFNGFGAISIEATPKAALLASAPGAGTRRKNGPSHAFAFSNLRSDTDGGPCAEWHGFGAGGPKPKPFSADQRRTVQCGARRSKRATHPADRAFLDAHPQGPGQVLRRSGGFAPFCK